MINKKEDLINTYIENDHGELRDLYINKAVELGFAHQGYRDKKVDWYNLRFVGICSGWCSERLGQADYVDEMIKRLKCRKLILSDLKPRTRTECEKATESIFDLRDEFERGELYWWYESDCKDKSEFVEIRSEYDLSTYFAKGNIFKRVEKEIDWRVDADNYFLKTKYLGIDCTIEEAITRSDYCDEFLELCRVALRANGEVE